MSDNKSPDTTNPGSKKKPPIATTRGWGYMNEKWIVRDEGRTYRHQHAVSDR
jgi:hypothetical protein